MASVPRTTRLLQVAMVAAVAAIFALAYLDLGREQARALDDFTAEQAALAQALAATVEARLHGGSHGGAGDHDASGGSGSDGVNADAALAARLFAGAPPPGHAPTRWLLVDGAGAWWALAPATADEATTATAGRAASGNVAVAGNVATADAGTTGRAASGNGAAAGNAAATDGEVAALVARMAAGASGTLLLGRPGAAALGLERRMAVAAWAPVPRPHGRPWSVGAVVSAMRVRDRARLAAWRLGAATGLSALLVALFGVALRAQERRAQRLVDALRLAEATAALRERSEKLVEAIPLGVLALDGSGAVAAVNPWLAARGVQARVPLATALAEAAPDDAAALGALVAAARASGRPASRADLRLRLGGDGLRDLDAYAVPLARPLADADAFLVLHDRTEIRVLERNLARADKLATIGTLAAGVAHEMGTPLGIISGRAEQLLGRLPPGDGGEAARKAVASILAQVDKVSTTIRQLLDFARARPIEAVAVTPAQLVAQAAALLEHRFRQARVTLDVDAPATVAAVAADPGQLEQVLVNLLINACDASAAGARVVVRARAEGERVRLEVSDEGCGIAPEHLSAVLDPFFTTKKRGQGTGLGLTIAADIVKNHGGTLEIESALGVGTTVRVRLPLANSTTTEAR